ncbi:hypothetical protein [Lutibacter sp.]
MKTDKKQSFFKMLFYFGIFFLIVVTLIKVLISIVKNGGVSGMISEYFAAGVWQQFIKVQVVLSLIYGAFMAGYYKFIKK